METADSERVRDVLREAIESTEMESVRELLSGSARHSPTEWLERYLVDPTERAGLRGSPCFGEQQVERFLLAAAALANLDAAMAQPLDLRVQALRLAEFELYAAPDRRRRSLFTVASQTFRSACEVVLLQRFPAGQLHWNLSGLSRRDIARVPLRQMPAFLSFLAFTFGGRGPVFFSHVNGLRKNRFIWLGQESNESYWRVAWCMRLQPRILGLVTRSWFHNPSIAQASPRLEWLNRVILENNGRIVRNGSAGTDSGFLENNGARQAAYEAGSYQPHYGLVA